MKPQKVELPLGIRDGESVFPNSLPLAVPLRRKGVLMGLHTCQAWGGLGWDLIATIWVYAGINFVGDLMCFDCQFASFTYPYGPTFYPNYLNFDATASCR